MAFETVVLKSTRNGITPILGYRQDLAVSNLMHVSLIDTTTSQPPVATSYLWQLIGRPEGSAAGGAGPEPVTLGIGSSANFTVDTDAGFPKDGAYKVRCTLNGGTGTEAHIEAILVRLSGITLTDGRDLRKLAAFEDLTDDTSIVTILQGWATMMNRWLDKVGELSGGGPIPPSATDRLQETLVNQSGVTLPLGTAVVLSGNGVITYANANTDTPPRVVGITGASITNTNPGLVRTHGQASVRLLASESPAAGDLLYLAVSPSSPYGYATTAKPGEFSSGEWSVPLGVVKDASPYTGVLGDLVVADLFINQPSMTWETSGRCTNDADVLDVVVPTNSTALVEVDLVGLSDHHAPDADDDCQARYLVTAKNVAGAVTISSVTPIVLHRTQVAFGASFATGVVGSGLGVNISTTGSGSAAHDMKWAAYARVTARRSAAV